MKLSWISDFDAASPFEVRLPLGGIIYGINSNEETILSSKIIFFNVYVIKL